MTIYEREGKMFFVRLLIILVFVSFVPRSFLTAAIVTPEGEVIEETPAQSEQQEDEETPNGVPAKEKKEQPPVTLPSKWPPAKSKQFGLGFILGEPTGLSFRWFFHEQQGLDALAAWSWGYDHHARMLFHVDYLFRFYDLIPIPAGDTALYVGPGMRIGAYDHHRWDDNDPEWWFLVGFRVPGGILYQVRSFPLEVLFEIAFVMDILPSFWPGFNIGLGLRFCF